MRSHILLENAVRRRRMNVCSVFCADALDTWSSVALAVSGGVFAVSINLIARSTLLTELHEYSYILFEVFTYILEYRPRSTIMKINRTINTISRAAPLSSRPLTDYNIIPTNNPDEA